MEKIKLPAGSTAIVIVAHPDDETIWLGGSILANPQVNWTILCLSRVSDTDREPKFRKVCAYYQAESLMDDWDDEGRLSLAAADKSAKKIIAKHLSGRHFDFLFTHGINGEYGHERHRGLASAVRESLKKGVFSAGAALAFNYKKISKHQLAPKADSDFLIKLSKEEFARKKAVMSEIYGFDPQGIDANYCTNLESLKLIKYN